MGTDLGPGGPRRVVTEVGSEEFRFLLEVCRRIPDGSLHAGWTLKRKYTPKELKAAELFYFSINSYFEPFGEQCGTVYDESRCCPQCGGGNARTGPLVLNLRRAPKKKQLARTFAPEFIVSQTLAELFLQHGVKGCELRPVIHKPYFNDEPVDFRKVPTGQKLLRRAKLQKVKSWQFCVWLNEVEQMEWLEQATYEFQLLLGKRERKTPPPPPWYELIIHSKRISICEPTKIGSDFFRNDEDYGDMCIHAGKFGHKMGLNVLSEVSVLRSTWDNSDIACTGQLIGNRMGMLRPEPLMMISPRLYWLLNEWKIGKYYTEVAYLK